jgi:N6-adenosine-specific RNA methylase IME4
MDIPFPNKKYKIIYVDPPWEYRDKRDVHPRLSGGATVHYETMATEEIKKMPVNLIADNDCIIFLWVTFPNLKDGLEVMESWGFKYKTLGFSWIKLNEDGTPFFGIGYYTKSNCEVCLIGTKGKPQIINNFVSSVILSKRKEHSRKPDEIRRKIVQLCGELPRIELFARQRYEGWDSWGKQLSNDIQTTIMKNNLNTLTQSITTNP